MTRDLTSTERRNLPLELRTETSSKTSSLPEFLNSIQRLKQFCRVDCNNYTPPFPSVSSLFSSKTPQNQNLFSSSIYPLLESAAVTMDSRVFLSLFIFLFFLLSFPILCHCSWWWNSQKETFDSHLTLKPPVTSPVIDPSRVTQISWRPRAFLYKGFLTDDECDHMINLARDKLEVSMVADNESGKSIKSEVRTSSGMFLRKHQDEVVSRIEARIAAWTFLPEENGEAMQVLHYELGQKYEPHFDYFHDKANQQLGGHRVATVLMYLSNIEKGGETVFPHSEIKKIQPKDDTWSGCSLKGYAVKPRKGDALLFFSLLPNTTTDPTSLHGSCPVIEGEKWSATKWIHVKAFDKTAKRATETECDDENDLCERWAALGECKKNPVYMVGNKDSLGYCRKSCKVC